MKKLLLLIAFALVSRSANAQTQLWAMTTANGSNVFGCFFKMNLDGSGYNVVHNFSALPSYLPYGSLLYASNGKLYGMTNLNGSIFSYDPFSNTFSNLHTCTTTTGIKPWGKLIQSTNGKLYGITAQGGSTNEGALFSFNINTSVYTTLYSFNQAGGFNSIGSLLEASNGKLYGMTLLGGTNNKGVIFSFDTTSNSYSDLYNFGDSTNAASPYGSLIQATNGLLYGMTKDGGANNYGVLFSFDPITNIYTDLFDFDNTNGRNPFGSLIQATDGKLYGMNIGGVTHTCGFIFRYDISTNNFHPIFDFNVSNGLDGCQPKGSLFQASNGKLYGMAGDGVYSSGVIFNYDLTDSTYTKLRDLNPNINDGVLPYYSSFIEIPYSPNLGINNITEETNISIYPNPFSSQTTITFSEEQKHTIVSITDVLGKEVYHTLMSGGAKSLTIEKGTMQPGIYFVKATDQHNKVSNLKVMVQ